MRVKANFTVFPKKLPSGNVVFYYQCYDEDGNRTNGRSTGEKTRTAANKKCMDLYREGKLLPSQQVRIPTFAEYAEGWWEQDTCAYLKKKQARKALSVDYQHQSKTIMKNYLVPYFGKMRLDRITDEDIDTWLVNFVDREKSHRLIKKIGNTEGQLVPKKLMTSTANNVFQILKLMLKQAVKRHIILFNPADNVEKLMAEPKQVEILRLAEVKQMFAPKPKAIPMKLNAEYDKKAFKLELAQMANALAACTGMRIGEVLGLKGNFVFADFIRVNGQYGAHGYGPTKTRTKRNIPLSMVVMNGLRKLADMNGEGYLFSADGGAKPISRYYFNKYLASGLEGIGIDKAEKKRRNLTPHAWRHFLNTALRAKGVPDAKVQSITGHKSRSSTERYTHFYNEEFSEVREVQNTLLLAGGGNGVSPGSGSARVRPVRHGRRERYNRPGAVVRRRRHHSR